MKSCSSFLALFGGAAMALSCTGPGMSFRPDGTPGPQKCPEKALEAMRYLRLRPGDCADVDIDANQRMQEPIRLYDGSLESILTRYLGWLPVETRLYAQVWTGGPSVVIRYHTARPPDGDPIPICAVARMSKGQMQKLPGSPPGMALLEFPDALLCIVDEFR